LKEGIILEAIIEGMSEYYSADLAVKVLRGMKDNALKAKYNGGNHAFGYIIDENKHFKPDPLTAPIVVEVFKKYTDGLTMKGIAEYLKTKNILTDKGRPIDQHRIGRMLSNRRYLGEYRFKDVIIPDAFEPIIPQNLFDEVQSRLKKNKKGAAKYKARQLYLLSDKLFCGKCGAKMVGECGRSASGATYYYYKCSEAKRRKCSKRSVKKQYIEDVVIQHTMNLLNDKSLVARIVDTVYTMQSQKNTVLPILEKHQIEYWICQWREINLCYEKERKDLIDIFVNSVYHYDTDLIIMFNHKDGEKTVTLDKVNKNRSTPAKDICSDTRAERSPRKTSEMQ